MKLYFAFLLAVGLSSCMEIPKLAVISVPNGGPWGGFGGIEVCPGNSKAVGFSVKVEQDQGNRDDDTALNGIALECFDFTTFQIHEVKSIEGGWGVWSGRISCLGGGFLTSFQLRVEAPMDGDDTAANDINFKCNTGEILQGHGTGWGTFGEWSAECPTGICGIETKVEPYQGTNDDDTALNDVRFLCC